MSTETICHFGYLLLVSNHRLQQFLKNPLFYLFPIQKHKGHNLTCCKIGQGQRRVIIWTNLVVLEHPMLYTNFQGHRPFGSGEEDFFKVFTISGHDGHLGHVTWKVLFPHAMEAPYEIWLWLAKQFLRRRCIKSVDDDGRQTVTDDWRQGPTYTISSPIQPKGSGELKIISLKSDFVHFFHDFIHK